MGESKKESRGKSSKGKKKEKEVPMRGLEGDIFKFTSKERYKTK